MKFFGTPDGVHIGQLFIDRADLRASGVHPPLMNGIHGTATEGADSIVMSGGYTDDEDFGDYIIYTGEGGNDTATKKQVKDQSLDSPGNAGLITSQLLGLRCASAGVPSRGPPSPRLQVFDTPASIS